MSNVHQKLFEESLLDQSQFELIDAVTQKKVVSLYYELRLMLYLGVLLFTGGIGYIAYQNLGDISHIAVMLLMAVGIGCCSYYIFKKSLPYSNSEVKVDHIYFDYLLILTALLIIALFTYVQVYFDLVEYFLQSSSIITAALFFAMAYRFDNKAVLSMGVTALAAAFGLTISPVNWVSGSWLPGLDLYIIGALFGVTLLVVGELLSRKNIKKHFAFTYFNFGLLLFYASTLALLFDSGWQIAIAFLLFFSAGAIVYYTWLKKAFVFFLYSSVAAYIGFTYLFVRLLTLGNDDDIVILIYYFPISCIAYVMLLVKHKNHFSDDE